MTDPTRRFSGRVENYVRYRPGYPRAIIALLQEQCGLTPEAVIADVGSGTGILSELFLKHGNRVYGVEPNGPMRAAAEGLLKNYPGFVSVPARAEATTLEDGSVDLIVVGQAFHWFDIPRARVEFARILKPGGWVVLVWNTRRTTSTPFMAAYERLVNTYAPEYREVTHRRIDEATIGAFYAPGTYRKATFDNRQSFDFEGLKGRLLSSSYTPQEGHPAYGPMLDELRAIFDEYQQHGRIEFEYDTEVYYGRLA
jgi:SAM-dependent methyltransferase